MAGLVKPYLLKILKKKLIKDEDGFNKYVFDSSGELKYPDNLGELVKDICIKYLWSLRKDKKGQLKKGDFGEKAQEHWEEMFKKKHRGNDDFIIKSELHFHITTDSVSLKKTFTYNIIGDKANGNSFHYDQTFHTVAWCFEYQCWEDLNKSNPEETLTDLRNKFENQLGYDGMIAEIDRQLELLEDDKRSKEKKIPLKEVEDKEEQSQNPKLDYNFSYKHIENQSKLETLRILFIEKCCLESEDELKSIEYVLSVLDGFYSFFKDEVIDALTKVREIFQRNPKNYTHFSHFCPEYQKAFNKKGKVKFQIAKQSEINDFLIGKWQNIKPLTLDSIILYLGIDKVKFEEYYTKRINSNYSPKNLRKQLEESVKNYPAKKGISKNVRYSLASILVLGLFSILFFTGIFDKFQKNTSPVTTTQQAEINSIWESKDPDTFKLLVVPLKSYSTKLKPENKKYNYKEILRDRFDGIKEKDRLNMEIQLLEDEELAFANFTKADKIISEYGADIVLWGDVDDVSKDPLINLNYSLSKRTYSNHNINQKRAGNSGYGVIKEPIFSLKNGSLQGKIDDIIFWIIAENHYKSEQYVKSISSIKNIDFNNKCMLKIHELAGNSYVKIKKYKKALEHYNSILSCVLEGRNNKKIDYNYFFTKRL